MGRHIIQREGSADTGSTSQTETDMYDLYGVTNHYGNINGGHYTGKQVENTCLNFPTHIIWMCPLSVLGASGYFVHFSMKFLLANRIAPDGKFAFCGVLSGASILFANVPQKGCQAYMA